MPQLKQSAKRLRQSKKRALANQRIKAHLDYLSRQLKKSLAARDENKAAEQSRSLCQSIDKARKRNIYKKNSAARRKSKIMKEVNALNRSKTVPAA